MTKDSKYLLDTNIFIEAYKRYYAFDIAPSFWESLKNAANKEKVISIDRVKLELLNGNKDDELSKWVDLEISDCFMSTEDSAVFESYSKIIQWVQEQKQYFDYAKREFANVADSWIVAYALAYGFTIVTHEHYSKDVKNRVLIPNVCKYFNIPFTDTFEMLRNLNIKI